MTEQNYMRMKGFFDFAYFRNNMKPELEVRYLNLCKSGVKQKNLALAFFVLNKFNLTNKKLIWRWQWRN